jgi:hypothetical protein
LTNADITTFAGDAVDAICFQAKVNLDGPKASGNLPGGSKAWKPLLQTLKKQRKALISKEK